MGLSGQDLDTRPFDRDILESEHLAAGGDQAASDAPKRAAISSATASACHD